MEGTLITIKFERDAKGTVKGYGLKGTGMASNWKRGDQVVPLRKPIKVPLHLLERYAGKYFFKPNMVFEVLLEKGRLFGRVGKDQKELIPFA